MITKGPAIETTGLLAALFPEKFVDAGGEGLPEGSRRRLRADDVLDDCAIARTFRGVHVMHDATECGVWGGLYEMARAGGYGLRIEEDPIPVQPVVSKTAEIFGFDPFSAISEGTLIAMVDRKDTDGLIGALKGQGIPAAVAGEVVAAEEGMKIVGRTGARALVHPKVDPYWALAAEFSK